MQIYIAVRRFSNEFAIKLDLIKTATIVSDDAGFLEANGLIMKKFGPEYVARPATKEIAQQVRELLGLN